MTVRFPRPLVPGDRVGVTSPSSGIADALRPRFEHACAVVRAAGYDVVVGDCMDGSGVVSAPAAERAAELMAMLLDPTIRAIVPPWGGELAVDLMPHLDFAAIAAADPTWVVGYSDMSTVLLPLTTLGGMATLHGQNLMDTPYRVPSPLLPWLDVVSRPAGAVLEQGASQEHRRGGFDSWEDDPTVSEYTFDSRGTWRPLAGGPVSARGRLIGGCIETISLLAGTPYGDVPAWADQNAPDGIVLYLEAAEDPALIIARSLWRLRLAGWFDRATCVLVGRTVAPDSGGFTQLDAVRSAFDGLDVPLVLDVDCGHVPPMLSLVNGALAEVSVDDAGARLVQHLA